MIKVFQGCILRLLLHSVNSVLILYWTGNMQSAVLLSFVASSFLPIYVIYYYVIWTDSGSMLLVANTRRQEGKYLNDKSIAGLHPCYYYIQSIQCPSFTGLAICNLLYFYRSSHLPPYHYVGFNLLTCGCPVISVHM